MQKEEKDIDEQDNQDVYDGSYYSYNYDYNYDEDNYNYGSQ